MAAVTMMARKYFSQYHMTSTCVILVMSLVLTTGEYNLMIVDSQIEDDAEFQCQVGATVNSAGIRSNSAQLSVLLPPEPPQIENARSVIAVILNQPTNITCRANGGKPAATITWLKGGLMVTDHVFTSAVPQADGKRMDAISSLTISPSKSDSGKQVACHAMNEAMVDPYTTSAILDVQYTPEIKMKVNLTRAIREYQYVRFSCDAIGNPYEITWKWYRNEDLLENQTRNYMDIPSIRRTFNGDTISCEATNSVGSTKKTFLLNVEYGPQFIGPPEHEAVDIDDPATLKCQADGNPKPSIIWTRKGSKRILSSSPNFKLPAVTQSNFGIYMCTATVMGFNEISREIYLLQNGKPRIMSEAEQFAGKGENAIVHCEAMSVPKPDHIIWTRNGQIIDYASSGRFSAQESDLPYGRKSSLQILNIHEEDFGAYNCSVINRYGDDNAVIYLKERESFPLPYVIGGAVGGSALLFILIVGCVLYQRNKGAELESYTDSDSTTDKKKEFKSDSPADFKSTLMDQWRQDYNKDLYRYSADYDELNINYPGKEMRANNNGFNYGPDIIANDPYTTDSYIVGDEYSHRDDEVSSERCESSYSTGYVPRSFRNDYSNPYPNTLPPAEISTSRLATNV
ncbi:kin of IRRE-like protein 1 isoform X2 [Liolophura sinensis]|uniref:kin of IRRE-like protein 1 isoform X2 n=1 Tax=Liolophura sinensis TaxID=3198878 RepID=UPI003158B0BB